MAASIHGPHADQFTDVAQDQVSRPIGKGKLIMTRLLERLAQILVGMGGNTSGVATPLRTDRTTLSRWDEVLMACMYDETAHKYLDCLGPRR